jgi:hypothetical protein
MSDTNNGHVNGAPKETPEQAIRRAVREAILTHAKPGRSVVGSENGKIVHLTPEEVFALRRTWEQEAKP